jgi:hypothetical protein
MGINPKDLGPPVFKYEQVITMQDLIRLRKHYFEMEKYLFLNQQMQDSMRACFAHLTLEGLIDWLESGKPMMEAKDE